MRDRSVHQSGPVFIIGFSMMLFISSWGMRIEQQPLLRIILMGPDEVA